MSDDKHVYNEQGFCRICGERDNDAPTAPPTASWPKGTFLQKRLALLKLREATKELR